MNSETPNGSPPMRKLPCATLLWLRLFVLMRDLNFTVKRGDVFIIMGGSGCGKSTLLRNMIGLIEPAEGEVFYDKAKLYPLMPSDGGSFFAASASCIRVAVFGVP